MLYSRPFSLSPQNSHTVRSARRWGRRARQSWRPGTRGSTHTPTNSAKLASDICKAVFDGSLEKLNFLELYAGATSSSLSKEIKTTR